MFSTCYVPLHFCKASRKSLKQFSSYRKGKGILLGSLLTMFKKLQKQVIQSFTVLVFCKLNHGEIHLHKVSRKHLEQFLSYKKDTNIIISYIIIGFLIKVQVQGQHPHQWAPFQIAGLLHAWQISHQISRYVYHEG